MIPIVCAAVLNAFVEFKVDSVLLGTNGTTFVEMGANDGLNSHSLILERHGWRGTCIEASPDLFARLERNRPLCQNVHAVVWHEARNLTFRSFPATSSLYGHSGIYEARSEDEWRRLLGEHRVEYTDAVVQARPIAGMIPDAVDVFILDVEGAEMAILAHFPWDRIRVENWLIESNKLNRRKLKVFMKTRRFDCVHVDPVNTLCRATHGGAGREQAKKKGRFRLGP